MRAAAIVARYDKIHMFDIDLPGGESYRESNAYRPGGRTVVAETPWGRLGMSVCYDVRFPHLYRALAQAGADFLTVPVGLHGADRDGALARAAAGAGDRERLLCVRAGAMGRACRRPAQLWPLADRRSVGRGAWPMAARVSGSSPRGSTPPRSPRRAAWCRHCSTTAPLPARAGSAPAGRRVASSSVSS